MDLKKSPEALSRHLKKIILTAIAFFIAVPLFANGQQPAQKDEIILEKFSNDTEKSGLPKGWKPFEFPKKPKHTEYTIQKEGDNYFLKAESNEAASAVYKEVKWDLKEFPILKWRWKVEGVLKKGDERKKEGDDYAARVYVVFEYEPEKTPSLEKIKYRFLETVYGMKPPGNAINYIWANKLPKDETVNNPFTEKVMMIAIESGTENAGKWIDEERNIYDDYKKLFRDEPPKVTGIILMTDTDNTKEKVTAYYDDISFRKHPAARAESVSISSPKNLY
ncbi:MAG: DUF3047 domain-containing protein [Deltaproteobacteria bacterium]|nr:DUF3047 domain-containing protein [Deltaproteobacteria bacterium]